MSAEVDTLDCSYRFLTQFRALERAHALGDWIAEDAIWAAIDPLELDEIVRELRALADVKSWAGTTGGLSDGSRTPHVVAVPASGQLRGVPSGPTPPCE